MQMNRHFELCPAECGDTKLNAALPIPFFFSSSALSAVCRLPSAV
jgi:hypothetical protein